MKFLELFWIKLNAEWFFFTEYWKTVFKYYRKPSFAKADLLLVFGYMFKNPYKISKEFLISKGESSIYAYGETPLTTMQAIIKKCRITKKDTIYELGCGRGRTCFWLSQWLGCRVVGIEFISQFVKIANIIKDSSELKNLDFRCEDFTESSLDGATVIYLYGICLDDEAIKKLTKNIIKLPPGTKVITVSFPLSDYDPSNSFEVMHRFSARFAWGKADVYSQIRK